LFEACGREQKGAGRREFGERSQKELLLIDLLEENCSREEVSYCCFGMACVMLLLHCRSREECGCLLLIEAEMG
jgi:hypothetical protein